MYYSILQGGGLTEPLIVKVKACESGAYRDDIDRNVGKSGIRTAHEKVRGYFVGGPYTRFPNIPVNIITVRPAFARFHFHL